MPELLIIQLARMGDFLQTYPLIQGLKRSFSGYRLTVLTDRRITGIVKTCEEIDEVIPFNLATFCQQMDNKKDSLGRQFQKIEKELHRFTGREFDLVFNLNHTMIGTLILPFIHAKKVIGYRLSEDRKSLRKGKWLSFVYNSVQKRKINRINLVDVFRYLNPRSTPFKPPILTTQRKEGVAPLIGFQMGSRHPHRQWSIKNFARLAKKLIREIGARIVLFGTRDERVLTREFFKILTTNKNGSCTASTNITDMTGKTTISQLTASLKQCDVLISGDTGTMHLAAHLGIPVLALFIGPAWCHETGPYGPHHFVIQTTPQCGPCLESKEACPEISCQELINPELVFSVACKMLGESVNLSAPAPSVRVYRSVLDGWGIKYLPAIPITLDEDELQAIVYRELGRRTANHCYEIDRKELLKEIQSGYSFDDRWFKEKIESIRTEGACLIYRRVRKAPPLMADYGGEAGSFFSLIEEWLSYETVNNLFFLNEIREIVEVFSGAAVSGQSVLSSGQ